MKPLSNSSNRRTIKLPLILALGFSLQIFNTHSLAVTPEEIFTQGNAAFVAGNYAEAIRQYESLLEQRCYSATLFFNLANAYSLSGKAGPAILNYERALWLDPGDADFKANLDQTRRAAGLFESPPTLWETLSRAIPLNAWLWMAAVSFVLISIACTFRWLKLFQWKLRPWILFFAIICVLSSASASIWMIDSNRAVVVTPDAPLQIAPLENSSSIFNLTAGSIVRIQKQRDHFYYIRTQDGKLGWVSNQKVQPIVNPS